MEATRQKGSTRAMETRSGSCSQGSLPLSGGTAPQVRIEFTECNKQVKAMRQDVRKKSQQQPSRKGVVGLTLFDILWSEAFVVG